MLEAKSHLLEATELLQQALELNRAVLDGDIAERAALEPAARFVEQAIAESNLAKDQMRSFIADAKT